MVFSEDVVKNAFDKVNGYCQICGKKLIFNSRGNAEARGAWEARHIKPVSEGGKDEVRNCMVLCMECYDKPAVPMTGKTSPPRVEGPLYGDRRR